MEEASLDAFLVLSGENRRYLSSFAANDGQFNESAGALFITQKKQFLLTDSRFASEAQQDAPLFETVTYPKGLSLLLPELCKNFSIHTLALETSRLTYTQFSQIRKEFENFSSPTRLLTIENLVEKQRMYKDETEINLLRKALHLSEETFIKFLKTFHIELTEKEAAWQLEKLLREQGLQLSFPIIAATGPNSAHPHATPGNRKFKKGDFALFDFGARYQGYCADITRTFSPSIATSEFIKAFEAVRVAQELAISKIRAGAHGQVVDQTARKYLEENGFAGKFTHSLGHGVGLQVHEAPRLSPIKNDILEEGMVITVEPGVYIEGLGGIRLEQMVVVRSDHGEILNSLSNQEVLDQMLNLSS